MKANKAFSVVEISVVITIIGIIIAGIFQGFKTISSNKLKIAIHLTNKSPILSIKNLSLWYETTLTDESLIFVNGEARNGAKISGWNNIAHKNLSNGNKPSSARRLSQTNSNAYANYNTKSFANSIPGVNLNDVFGDGDFLYNGNFNYRTRKLTLFMVIKRRFESWEARIISGMPNGITYDYSSVHTLMLQTRTQGNLLFSRSRVGSITHPDNNTEFILTHTFDADNTNSKIYINGELKMESTSATNTDIIIDKFYLGKANYAPVPTDRSNGSSVYHGDYGEMVFFDDILSDIDRKRVETYLSKKFNIKLKN